MATGDGSEVELVISQRRHRHAQQAIDRDHRSTLGQVRFERALEHISRVHQRDGSAVLGASATHVVDVAREGRERAQPSVQIIEREKAQHEWRTDGGRCRRPACGAADRRCDVRWGGRGFRARRAHEPRKPGQSGASQWHSTRAKPTWGQLCSSSPRSRAGAIRKSRLQYSQAISKTSLVERRCSRSSRLRLANADTTRNSSHQHSKRIGLSSKRVKGMPYSSSSNSQLGLNALSASCGSIDSKSRRRSVITISGPRPTSGNNCTRYPPALSTRPPSIKVPTASMEITCSEVCM